MAVVRVDVHGRRAPLHAGPLLRLLRRGRRRRKVERRINEYRLAPEVLEFINAVNEFKSVHQKPFPTWSEIYGIFIELGYSKSDD